MRVIDDLMRYLCCRNILSFEEYQQIHLRVYGVIEYATEFDENEFWFPWDADVWLEDTLKRVTTRERRRQSSGRKSKKKATAKKLIGQLDTLVDNWILSEGKDLLQSGLGMSGPWESECAAISRSSDDELLEMLRRSRFCDVLAWLFRDPFAVVTGSGLFLESGSYEARYCRRVAAHRLMPWRNAQVRVCKALADIVLASQGLVEMIDWSDAKRMDSEDKFVWLLFAGRLLHRRVTSPESLGSMILPEESVFTLRRHFWLKDEPLSQDEYWQLSLIVEAMALSKSLIEELVGYPEIRIRWVEIPEHAHRPVKVFLSKMKRHCPPSFG